MTALRTPAHGPRQGQLLQAWSGQHARLAGLVVMVVASQTAAAFEPGHYRYLAGLVLVTTVLAALLFDGFGGIVVGVTGAAALVAVKQRTGAWTDDSFVVSLALVVGLVASGWFAGMVSSDLHNRPLSRGVGFETASAQGSLGLLDQEAALARLDEEMVRARVHRRPLTVLLLTVETAHDLSAQARDSAERTIARLLETLLRDTDVPFALSAAEFGAILPETDAAGAYDVIGPVLDAASQAAFTVRDHAGERRKFSEVAEVSVGLASSAGGYADSDALLRAARPGPTEALPA